MVVNFVHRDLRTIINLPLNRNRKKRNRVMLPILKALILSLTISYVICGEIKNVLLLLADDAGFEMGAYLNKYTQTANLDALAKRGLLFNNAFTTVSSCSPSRAALLTGEPAHTNGMYGLHHDVHNFNVLPQIQSLPNILREHQINNQILSGIIGKKHVGPSANFKFDYEQTEEQHPINQIGRNITNIKLYTREFLQKAITEGKSFFLMVSFHDPHRCGHITPEYGAFCERWGTGEEGMGIIPDWKPIYYDWRNIKVPPHLPQTPVVAKELAAQYMTISRLDQGIGLILNELKNFNLDNDTLIMYTSDNGPPFPGARTNMYEQGVKLPFILTSPNPLHRHHETTAAMTTLSDIYRTVLDVFNIPANNFTNYNNYTKSLLPLLDKEPKPQENDAIFGSHNYHEVTMNYPMRMIRTRRYKLIHNLNYWSLFPIDQDFYMSPTFQEMLNNTIHHEPLCWYKSLSAYYQRPEWELYDIKKDPLEKQNLVDKPKYKTILDQLKQRLKKWQADTEDPWRCAPHDVLQNQGEFKDHAVCLPLGHDNLKKHFTKYEKYEII